MKKVKFIFIFFLILLSFVFSGEFFQNYLNSFTSQFYYIDISEDRDFTQPEIQAELTQVSEKYNIDFFAVQRINESSHSCVSTVYCSKKAQDRLKKEYAVAGGEYNALLSGTTKVSFASFSDRDYFPETQRYYFLGDNRDAQLIRNNISDDFACSFVKKESEQSYRYLILMIWAFIGVLFLILTWLDIHFQKKENFVLISLGKPIHQIILKNILIDFLAFSVIFTGLYVLIGRFIYIGYEIKNIILLSAAVLLLNSLLYLTLFKINYKEVLYGANLNERIIADGYVLKSISMILTVVVLSCNAVLLSTNYKELKKSKQLESVGNYSFLQLNTVSFMDYDEDYEETLHSLIYSIYSELQSKGCAYSFCGLTGANDYCIINSDSKFLLNGFDCELETDSNIDLFVLVPEKPNGPENVDEIIPDCIEMYFDSPEELNCKKVTYSDGGKLLLYDNSEGIALGAEQVENPIIIYVNNSAKGLIHDKSTLSSLFGNMLFSVSDSDIKQLSEKYSLREKGFYLQSVKMNDKLLSYQSVLNRALLLNTVISAFLLLLELFIISVIIKSEYKVSTTELAIKKVLGYSVFRKNKQIFLLNTYATLIAVTACVVLSLMYKLSVWYIVIAVGASVLCLEYVIIAVLITRFEKQNIAKILKGGCL